MSASLAESTPGLPAWRTPHPCRLAARMPSQAGSLTSYFGCSRSKWFVSASSLVITSGSVAS
jgi:hypothetical protein